VEPLLAKSRGQGKDITLFAHTHAVVRAAGALFGTAAEPTRLGKAWLRFFKVPPVFHPAFYLHLHLSAVFHDLGKANDGFQAAVHGRGDLQAIFHDYLSALLLCTPEACECFRARSNIDHALILVAVAGHHLRLCDQGIGQWRSTRRWVCLWLNHPDVAAILSLAAAELGSLPTSWAVRVVWGEQDVRRLARRFWDIVRAAEDRLQHSKEGETALWRAVKAALIAADAAASALLREGHDPAAWVQAAFGRPLPPEDIRDGIIRARLEAVAQQRGQPVDLHDFQREAVHLGNRALLLAACGAGKTLAAWNWAQARLSERPAGRVLFLYPTRAAATEGFKDYGAHVGAEAAALMHGTAEYELEAMQGSPDFAGFRLDPRLPALAAWQRRVITATVDTFLPFLHYEYGALCLLPVLSDSVVILDEVHSYDASMFLALQSFLRHFDVPVLCMTATLTARRRQILADLGLEVYPDRPERFRDLHVAASRPRYRVHLTAADAAWDYLMQHLGEPWCRKVLWVVNRVSSCQQVTRRCVEALGGRAAVICYHSQFRLRDRQQRHRDLIEGFRTGTSPLVAVTTQVAQMSLDIDADLLITEVAPAPDLVQRMGRCCRNPAPGRLGTVLVYQPEAPRPYDKKDLEEAWVMVMGLVDGGPVSQEKLAEALQRIADTQTLSRGLVAFADELALARPLGSFRETDAWTVDAVLDSDLPTVLELRRHKRPVDGYVVPVPIYTAEPDARFGYLRVAPGSRYDPNLGFLAQEAGGKSG
jgi:CRISPR-associated endonuclease/helicase Cas3